jgi:nucleoid-associated protein YgaU
MYNGVKAMIDAEKKLMGAQKPAPVAAAAPAKPADAAAAAKPADAAAAAKPAEAAAPAKPADAAAPAKPADVAAAAGTIKAGPHLKKPEDITGMIEFPAGTKSLLCKYLTPEIFNEYKGKKDKCGVSFEQMILSGAQNIDSGIGAYAGSHDSYATFEKLFDKIIEDYHQHGKTGKHVSNMNYKELKCPPFTDEEAAMVNSTRIRVGRNLADYPLGPGITKA